MNDTIMPYDAHTVVEEMKGHLSLKALVFFLWMKGKYYYGANFRQLMTYGHSERHTRRIIAELRRKKMIVRIERHPTDIRWRAV